MPNKLLERRTVMNIQSIINLILRGIAVAMGVAAVVLGILGTASVESLLTLLGIGLFSLALWSFQKTDN
jgi:hypothetical protein